MATILATCGYLPDFKLTDLNCWFEAKGDYPTEWDLEKASRLADASGNPVVLDVGKHTLA